MGRSGLDEIGGTGAERVILGGEGGARATLLPWSPPGEARGIYLYEIEVPPELRGRGHGSRLLRRLCRLADCGGLTIVALPLGDTDGETARLRAWYARHGFADRPPRHPGGPVGMARPPGPVDGGEDGRTDGRLPARAGRGDDRGAGVASPAWGGGPG